MNDVLTENFASCLMFRLRNDLMSLIHRINSTNLMEYYTLTMPMKPFFSISHTTHTDFNPLHT